MIHQVTAQSDLKYRNDPGPDLICHHWICFTSIYPIYPIPNIEMDGYTMEKTVDVCTWPWESTSVASTWRRREAAGGDFNHTEGFLRL
jgi:hypothetical protein